jgi:hypothetical protein
MTTEVWPYAPQRDVVESFEWITDVQRCKSAEQRRSLRTKPRQELQLRHLMTAAQFGEAKLLAKDVGPDDLLIPMWPWFHRCGALASGANQVSKDGGDPISLHAADTQVLIWDDADTWEVATVDTPISDPEDPRIELVSGLSRAYAHAIMVPLRVGQFAQEFEATRASMQTVETSVRFRIMVADDFATCWNTQYHEQQELGLYEDETFRTFPVVTDRSMASGIKEQFERRFEEIDSVLGLSYRFPILSAPEQSGQFSWSSITRARYRQLIYWLHSRHGMWKCFWVPSWNSDLTVTAEIASNATTIQIADVGFRTRSVFPADIMILTKAGARVYCHVTSASAGTTGNEVLTVSSAVGAHLYTWDIEGISMLTLSRFAADRVEVRHAGENAQVTVSTVEVPA